MKFYCETGARIAFILLITVVSLSGQNPSGTSQVKLFGHVTNAWTGKGISGVNIYIESLKTGSTTDDNGYYELQLGIGTYTVKFSRIDLNPEVPLIDVTGDTELNLEMKEKVFTLEAIDIFSTREDVNIKSLDLGKNTVNMDIINSMPTFLGETDVIKSLILLPGVSTIGEGASGFNVRGGGVDQNLILQDGGQIFNSSHVFGFFSTFNPVTVNKATLYKSGIPAKYGGRLSSILNVELKEGDFQSYKASGGIGLVSSRLAIEGPIAKDKLSFIASTRISYSDWLLSLAEDPDVRKSTAAFQDVNAKLVYRMNPNNKFSYSGYLSNDKFGLASDTTFAWRTLNHNLQWSHSFNDHVFFTADLGSGRYIYDIEDTKGLNAFNVNSQIHYHTGRLDLVYGAEQKNEINVGVEGIIYEFMPGIQKPLGLESGVDFIQLEKEKSIELSLYAEDEFAFSEKFSLRAGLRFSMFNNLGPGSDFIYGSDLRENENIVDTVYYPNNEVVTSYQGLEPRLNLNYNISDNSSIKASYNRTRQYLHLITNTAAVTPTDLWKTSNRYIEPETGDQFALGYFRNFKNNTIEASVEAYYKLADNIVDFKDGTILLMNENLEADLINGTSTGYGLEFFINKKSGKLNGWMGYTYSRIFRTVDGLYDEEKINKGQRYPANNDKPHDVSLVMNYKASPVLEYSVNFVYSTGRPGTVPLSLYNVSNQTNIFNFSQRNQGRIPDYHRLDVSMTLHSKPRIDRKWKLSWTLAVYNLYGRKNAFSVFYENVYGAPPKAYKLSVLGSAFPSLMVNFNF